MVDDTQPVPGSTVSVCPWCSANYTGDPDTCPSCGAALAVDPATDPALPGLTAIDAAAIVRAKTPVARPRNRLLSWISGEYPDETPSPTEAGALAPPDLEVRREMLRLELEAEVANLQAEAGALIAQATVEGDTPEATPQTAAAAAAVVQDLGEVTAELSDVDEALDTDPLSDGSSRPV
ncbi:MAG TPA: hypothetical protein VHK05_07675 [Candidatus Limnocylindrales bacterium]|jgi:hypothetical protein|nr:hypothetical protein [Candidatus Limnocylindrales bacterium]